MSKKETSLVRRAELLWGWGTILLISWFFLTPSAMRLESNYSEYLLSYIVDTLSPVHASVTGSALEC
jgi:hypothetical protein